MVFQVVYIPNKKGIGIGDFQSLSITSLEHKNLDVFSF